MTFFKCITSSTLSGGSIRLKINGVDNVAVVGFVSVFECVNSNVIIVQQRAPLIKVVYSFYAVIRKQILISFSSNTVLPIIPTHFLI